MPRINRRARLRPRTRATRAQLLELALGPNGTSVFETDQARSEAWENLRSKLTPAFAERLFAGGNLKSYTETAAQYARDVVSNHIAACHQVREAGARHLADLERSKDPSFAYAFDAAKADRACRFIELLPHVKGNWAANAEYIRLEPWQAFIVCAIFGWVHKSTGQRRFTLAYVEVSRKNAKSTLAAGIGSYLFACDQEFGAEIYSGATTEKQALEVFRPALQMMERSPELARLLAVTPAVKKMTVTEDGSRFEPVVGKPGDGASPHGGIVDEYHEHDSDVLFDTFRTGMGARRQPLLLAITTAGDNLAGPCKLLHDDVDQILAGSVERDEVFGIIYTIDPDVAWASDRALEMANPNLGVSVFPEFLKTERDAALKSARKQGVFKTKHLCVWVGANAAYFNAEEFRMLGDPGLRLEDFIGLPCVAAVDLSTKNDMTVRALGFKKITGGKEHYYYFVRCYIPEAQIQKPENQHYRQWAESGQLIVHPGASVDFSEIERELVADMKRAKARELCYDPYNGHYLSQNVAKETRAEIVEFPQNTAMLSPGTKELDVLIGDHRAHHEGNPVLIWNMANVVAHEDRNENVFPQKAAGREEQKIDGAIALIMLTARLMTIVAKKSVYATRGIRYLDETPAQAPVGANA
jgi:phage terminase large subunit-like protein